TGNHFTNLRIEAVLVIDDGGKILRLRREFVGEVRRVQAVQFSQRRAGIVGQQIRVRSLEERLVPVAREARQLLVLLARLAESLQRVQRAAQSEVGQLFQVVQVAIAGTLDGEDVPERLDGRFL